MIIQGLSEKRARELRKEYGSNVLPTKEKISWFSILISQFKSPLIYILLIVGFVSFSFKEYLDASLIGLVISLNVLMGFFQEYNAQKTLLALRKILAPQTTVIREAKRQRIDAKDLVPGDFVVLSAGDKVPADGKFVEGINLLANEAILTGEEEALIKNENQGQNSLFMGTTVVSGRGIMEVTTIGKETEVGKIGASLALIKEEKTPLQIKLEEFSRNLTFFILFICFLIFFVGLLHREEFLYMLRFSVVLAVSAIPEGLPIAITVILALGMRRILKRNGLVKKLLSIETLGSTSVICTDKTGTLTEGIMKVVKAQFVDRSKGLLALALANDQKSNLEIALWDYLKEQDKFDPQEAFHSFKRTYEEPFDSEQKYVLTVNNLKGKETAFLVGAPEIILSFCKETAGFKRKVLSEIEKWADEGLRLVGATFKDKGKVTEKNGFHWLGLIGIEDPIRKNVKEAIITSQEAGIDIKIVTGDYYKTAERVALNLGFRVSPETTINGDELENISEQELRERIEQINLFTRVTPHQKLKIVTALQNKGEIVAMTGDGVNDTPALKKADIGVVVGTGSDIAKEAGDLILLDNNFNTIVAACEEGRLIFSNIKKVVGYVLSNSFAEIILIFGSMLLNLPTPLTILQILWAHLICDGPPDIVLGFEPKDKSLMEASPKEIKKEEILSYNMKLLIFIISLATGIMALLLFQYIYINYNDINLARTIAFATIATNSLIYIFAFKNLEKLIVQNENFFHNKILFGAVIYGFLFIYIAIYFPPISRILGTVPLNPLHWVLVLSVALLTTLFIEAAKLLNYYNKTRKIDEKS